MLSIQGGSNFFRAAAAVLVAGLVAGGVISLAAADAGARWVAAPLVITSLGVGILLGRVLPLVPAQNRTLLFVLLFLMALALMAVFCNIVALGPNMVDESSKAFATREVRGKEDPVARALFATAALLVNAALISTLVMWLRSIFRISLKRMGE